MIIYVPRSVPTSAVHEQAVTVHPVLGRCVGSVGALYSEVEAQLIDGHRVTAGEILHRPREKCPGVEKSAEPEVIGLAVVVPSLKATCKHDCIRDPGDNIIMTDKRKSGKKKQPRKSVHCRAGYVRVDGIISTCTRMSVRRAMCQRNI